MSRLIDADTVVHWQSYDDEHETFPDYEGTIAEFLDAMTDEGCPESVSVLPSALQEAIRRIETKVDEVYGYPKTEYAEGYVNACKAAIKMLKSLSPVDAVPVVRCKDCRWGREVCGNIECFVDANIPPEYHGYEWFCPNGERKDGEHDTGRTGQAAC